ncbi:hypothetical protein JNB62_13795 [Microbacterium jejuense]|uniref:Meckel syndrome type 1 protein n=1 Tax=Microbacterium jejuense TaxID=1263637 RepID=A0ABS7HP77_9MICO|nr:hypothetical protein [Microbacterium jejuense]MBW9094761.1 hypothetical protein [Microbacterium jejuense]
MSTPEQPATPALTRKQIRELRNTGSTPVITAAPTADAAPEAPAPVEFVAPTPPPAAVVPAPAAPFPRPAEPAAVPPAPVADASVDLGVSPLTRRQARQQERIRTASVPVITPEVVAAHAAATGAPAFAYTPAPDPAPAPAPAVEHPVFTQPQPAAATAPEPTPSLFVEQPATGEVSTDSGMHALFGIPRESEQEPPAPVAAAPATAPTAPEVSWMQPLKEERTGIDAFDSALAGVESPLAEEQKAVVSPLLGAGLLESETEPAREPEHAPEIPPSFDQLLSRTTGAIALPSALIVSQAPEVSGLVAPVTATGEVIVTGTFNLPEGLGSTGHAKGTADGKEIDATLVDGELPVHSSPTPIAASAAVSTVKMPGEVIKPPAPEKGGKLMMSLAVTAGVLALALVGVLILAFVTGVF